MNLTPEEQKDVNTTVAYLLEAAKSLPCKDAAKLLRGFILVAGPEEFKELRSLLGTLNHCQAQMELLLNPQPPTGSK